MVDFVLETEEDPEWSLADSRESRPEPDWVADPEWSSAPQRCSTPDPPPSPQTLRLSEKNWEGRGELADADQLSHDHGIAERGKASVVDADRVAFLERLER
jgi:hypothetical protein